MLYNGALVNSVADGCVWFVGCRLFGNVTRFVSLEIGRIHMKISIYFHGSNGYSRIENVSYSLSLWFLNFDRKISLMCAVKICILNNKYCLGISSVSDLLIVSHSKNMFPSDLTWSWIENAVVKFDESTGRYSSNFSNRINYLLRTEKERILMYTCCTWELFGSSEVK